MLKNRTVPAFRTVRIFFAVFFVVITIMADDVFATDAMVTYIDGNENTPRYKTWDGTTWSGESSAPDVGGYPYWQVLRSEPNNEENMKILGTLDDNSDINISTWTPSGGWSHIMQLTDDAGTYSKRAFDIAYEQLSGDIMVVYSVNTATPVYRVGNTSGWTTEAKVFEMGAGGDVEWVRLEPNPNSDEIILVTQHGNDEIWAQVWNGDIWANEQLLETNIVVTSNQCFDVAYEHSSGDAIVVWTAVGEATPDSTPRYRIWDGTAWLGEVTATDRIFGDLRWVRMASDTKSNSIIMATLDDNSDISVEIWDGSGWGNMQEVEINAPTYSYRCFDVAYSSKGNKGIIVWSDDTSIPKYKTWDGVGWSIENSAQNVGNVPRWITLDTDPFTDDFMLVTSSKSNSGSKMDIQRWNGSSWSNLTTLNNTGYKYESFAVCYDRVPDIIPPSAISNLTALPYTSAEGAVKLEWTAPGDDGTGGTASLYVIKCSSLTNIGKGNFSAAEDLSKFSASPSTAPLVGGTPQNMIVTGLVPGVTYWFAVIAKDETDNPGSWSTTTVNTENYAVAYDTLPALPAGFTAQALSEDSIRLSWNTSTEIDFKEYEIEYSSYSDIEGWQVLIATTAVQYDHTDLVSDNTYYYQIRSWDNTNHNTTWSSPVSAVPVSIPDNEAPVITHTPLTSRALGKDRILVEFNVTDNLKVEKAEVSYMGIGDETNHLITATPSAETTSFNVSLEINKIYITAEGFKYYITATDSVNSARYPVTGWVQVETPLSKPEQKFATPSNPEVVFGKEVEEVTITDVIGNRVFSRKREGSPFIVWNPAKNGKVKIESGLYIYRIKTPDGVKYGSIVIAK